MGPLRSDSSLTIWGPPSGQFLSLLYGAPQVSFFAYYIGGPLRSVSSPTIGGPLSSVSARLRCLIDPVSGICSTQRLTHASASSNAPRLNTLHTAKPQTAQYNGRGPRGVTAVGARALAYG